MGRDAGVVRVRIRLGPDGSIRRVDAEGHAGTEAAGSNPACAAVTVLLRTAYETLAGYPGVDVTGEAPAPGSLSFNVKKVDAAVAEKARGVGDFLLTGLSSVEREYPGRVHVELLS